MVDITMNMRLFPADGSPPKVLTWVEIKHPFFIPLDSHQVTHIKLINLRFSINQINFSHQWIAFAITLGAEWIYNDNRSIETRELTTIMHFT